MRDLILGSRCWQQGCDAVPVIVFSCSFCTIWVSKGVVELVIVILGCQVPSSSSCCGCRCVQGEMLCASEARRELKLAGSDATACRWGRVRKVVPPPAPTGHQSPFPTSSGEKES